MRRTLIQLDEDTYAKLRHRAFEHKRSISSVARELISTGLEPRKKKLIRVKDFSFIAAGSSKQGELSPVSARHDEALSEIVYARIRKK